MKSVKIQKLTLAGALAALTAAATLLIQIPSPTKGYINPGDVLVNLSAWILGPLYGGAAAGIGSALADLISGYTVYAPATLVIKAAMAVVSYAVFSRLPQKGRAFLRCTAAAAAAELLMLLGYAVFAGLLYGSVSSALLSIPENVIQGVFGTAGSAALYELVRRRGTRLSVL